MNFYNNNYSSMHSPYIHYDPYPYYHPFEPNGPNSTSYSHEPNDYYASYTSSYSPSYDQTSQYSHAYQDHSFQTYPLQEQSTQSSKLHDLLLKMQNNSIDYDKVLQNSIDTYNRISALCDKINKIAEKNARDINDEGETYEENDNHMTNLSDEVEESEKHVLNSSHHTPLDFVIEHEHIPQIDDGVNCKKDGDILSFSFKDMEESNEVSDSDSNSDSDFDSNSNSIHDLCYYFKDEFPPNWLDDKYDNDDDIISIDGVNMLDEETKDALLEDKHMPHMLENNDSLITMPDMHDGNNLDAILEEIPLISFNDSTVFDSYDYDKEQVENNLNDLAIYSFDNDIEDMEIISNLWSTESCIEESPIILSIAPPIPEYFIHGEKVLLEEVCHEYHDPYMIHTYPEYHDQSLIRYIIKDMIHSFYEPAFLSCLHHIFIKLPKIFHCSFIALKIKKHKKITLKDKFVPASISLIHWEDCFPLFLLFYDLV